MAETTETTAPEVTLDEIVALCKRRGFVFPSSEIYGGIGSTYDYGHYGVLLKGSVRGEWWRAMLQERDDIVALDSAILQHPRVWEASGHLAGFTDPLIDCRTCKLRFRADHIDQAQCGRKPSRHPGATPDCDLTEARDFNLMFETTMGAVKEAGSTVYLRPETAQGIFLNFKNYLQFSRKKPPFGIAQIGKSFRNEITPGNFIFRTREFEQMEMEFFVPPPEADTWFEHWCRERFEWYVGLGLRRDHLRLRPRGAPVKVAVLPLVRKDGQPELAREIYRELRGRMSAEYDEGGSIGKRYRRQDEIGTPWGVTVDHQTLEDRTVTLRDRDSLAQDRIAIDQLGNELGRRLAAPWKRPKLGT